MVRVIRVLGECHIVPSAPLISTQLHYLPEFIGELKDEFQQPLVVKYADKADSPLQSLKTKLGTNIRIKQHLKLTQSGL